MRISNVFQKHIHSPFKHRHTETWTLMTLPSLPNFRNENRPKGGGWECWACNEGQAARTRNSDKISQHTVFHLTLDLNIPYGPRLPSQKGVKILSELMLDPVGFVGLKVWQDLGKNSLCHFHRPLESEKLRDCYIKLGHPPFSIL